MTKILQAIDALKVAIRNGHFVERGSEEFLALNSSYLSGLESDIEPLWIFQPRTRDEVSNFLKTIAPFTGDVKFAVRGGGQQPLPGSANIQDGITVDLGLLRVYEKLDSEGLGVAGGRSSAGGIGGLSLQGGLSFLSSQQGFICDNVVNYEVVLASGEIVNANAEEHPDLWVALRGAGNNLGIVTRFDITTFKQGPLYGGTVFYFPQSFPGQIKALVNELKKEDASKDTHLMISVGYSAMFNKDSFMCLNQPYHTKGIEDSAELEPFINIQPQIDQMNTMRLHSLKQAADEQAASGQTSVRCSYMNITVKADEATLQSASEIYLDSLEPIKPVSGGLFSFTLQPYPVSLLEKSASSGGNILGLDPTGGPLVSILLLSYWKEQSDDKAVIGANRDALEKITEVAKSRGHLVPFVYMNYASSHQDPLGSYGKDNLEKLKQVCGKYDPDGLFQRSCPGGFKLIS